MLSALPPQCRHLKNPGAAHCHQVICAKEKTCHLNFANGHIDECIQAVRLRGSVRQRHQHRLSVC